jgi:ribosome biogenesis GTPase A
MSSQTASSQILDAALQEYRWSLNELLHDVQRLAAALNNVGLQETVAGLRKNITEPFLFVIVGEVKAGKSSFINALLEAEVCATDIEPCTDSIQQIVYADQRFVTQVEPKLKKIGMPIDILKDISIVDTPGTNTIIAEHQIITEKYIPNSDLTFFVLFAKNPYQKSAWDFLDFVSAEWRKKVVFVLQQADLLKPADLETNIQRVKEYANLKQIKSPIIFATSAEQELHGDIQNSGFSPIREYIKNMVASGESYKIKLRSVGGTAQKIIDGLSSDIQALQTQLEADKKSVAAIQQKIETGRKRSRYEVDNLAERLIGRYDSISGRIKREFRESLSVFTVVRRSFAGIFNKDASMQTWIKDFQERCERELKYSLDEVSNEGAQHFVDGIRQLLEGVTQDLNNIKTAQIPNSSISIKVLERRQDVIESVRCKVDRLFTDEGLVQSLSTADNMATEIVGGAFVAVAGMVMHIIRFTVAEAILDAIGIAFAGVGVLMFVVGVAWQRNQIIHRFERALDNEKDKFKLEVTERLNQKLSLIYEEVERIFVQFYDYVDRENQVISPIIEEYQTTQAKAQQLFGKMATQLD